MRVVKMCKFKIRDYHVSVSHAKKHEVKAFIDRFNLPMIGMVGNTLIPKIDINNRSANIIYGARTWVLWKGKEFDILVYPSEEFADKLMKLLHIQRLTALKYLLATLPKEFSNKEEYHIFRSIYYDKNPNFYMIAKMVNPELSKQQLRSLARQIKHRYISILKSSLLTIDKIAELQNMIIIIPNKEIFNGSMLLELRDMGIQHIEVFTPQNNDYYIGKLLDICMKYEFEPVVGTKFRIGVDKNYYRFIEKIDRQLYEAKKVLPTQLF